MTSMPTGFTARFYPKDRLGERLEIIAERRVPGASEPVAILGILRMPSGS
jgi:hypothetical protein